jgi:subtilisin family serine protease
MTLPTFRALATAAALGGAALALAGHAAAAGNGGGSGGGGGAGGSGTSNVDADVPGEVMVKLKSTNDLQPLLAKYPLTVAGRFGARPIFRLKVVGSARVKDILPGLALEPGVLIAETNPTNRSPEARRVIPWTIGNPGAYVAQWAPQTMHLPAAQALSVGNGVRVAVLDTGVDMSHPALAGRLLPGHDFVDDDTDPSEVGTPGQGGYGHGTHVAGLVALVAPGAQIMPLRVLDADGTGNAWVLAEALLYALDPDGNPATDDGAHVINMSLGSLARTRIMASITQIAACEPAVTDDPIADRSDAGYADDEARCAARAGVVVVAAAGNDATDKVKEYPAAEGAYGLLPVGAYSSNGRLAAFSNFGSWVDVAAPGDGLTSTFPGGGYATWSGTSMAAPLVAGTAALVRALDLQLPARDVLRRITRTTASLCGTALRGVDAAAAVKNLPAAPVTCR